MYVTCINVNITCPLFFNINVGISSSICNNVSGTVSMCCMSVYIGHKVKRHLRHLYTLGILSLGYLKYFIYMFEQMCGMMEV